MKSHNTLKILFIIICFSLFPGVSNSTLTPVTTQVNQADAELAGLFTVEVAKEPIYLILVEKKLQRLRVLEYDTELRVVAEYPCATGENFGLKEISGDSKTPEGIYFITQIFRDDKITIFGDKAFHLDYPNYFDREAGRNGDGIYIHGTNKKLEPNSTNGCITLANNDLDHLENYLNQVVTPVVIVSDLDSIIQSQNQLLTENDFTLAKSLLLTDELKPENVEYNYLYIINSGNQTVAVSDFIYRPFRRSIMRGASRTYLEYFPGHNWTARKRIWRVSPLQIYPEAPFKVAAHPLASGEVQLTELASEDTAAMLAVLNPQSGALQSSRANEQLDRSQGFAHREAEIEKKSVVREVFTPLEKKQQPAPVIKEVVPQLEKKQQPIPETVQRTQPTPAPKTIAANKIEQAQKIMVAAPDIPKDKQQILDFLEEWRQAWVSKNIDAYISSYDKTFKSSGKNLAEWKAHKANLNKTYAFIAVNISNAKVNWTDEGASVSFRQDYRSDRYRAAGKKTLFLVNSDLGWKIKREVYSHN